MMTFDEIVRKPQHVLKKALMSELNRMGYKTRTKKGFVYGKGQVPVMLVAHMDTVHKTPVQTVCYSADGNIVMSPEGIGGDDRAGVYMILQIIKKHRCHVLFCEDEEVGGIGASEFAKSGIKPEVNYLVELDRRGSNDAVFYDCDNPEFTQFVTDFGFKEDMGSFSDISIIAPELGVAAVNISAGYYNEHTRYEYVDMSVVAKNVERVCEMVSTESARFCYIEAVRFRGMFGGRYYEDLYDFGSYYDRGMLSSVKTLMMLPESCYVKNPNHEMEECEGQYFIDDKGGVYEYIEDIDVMIEADGFSAFGEQGLPARFKLKDSNEYEVVPEEYAYALEEEMYYDESWCSKPRGFK